MSQSITLDEIEKNKDNPSFFEKNLISIEDIFKNNEKIILTSNELKKFLNGVKLKKDLKARNI